MNISGLDFETFGKTDLRKHGLDRYVNDPSFTPLIASVDVEGHKPVTFDFIIGGERAKTDFVAALRKLIERQGHLVSAHNAGFERIVLHKVFGFDQFWLKQHIVDSAVVARCEGASSSLEYAAPQLTYISKLETGAAGIRKFSVPNAWNGGEAPTAALLQADAAILKEWETFARYCEVDAHASRVLSIMGYDLMASSMGIEREYERLTATMNEYGWKVDLDLVVEMQQRYLANVEEAKEKFSRQHDPKRELNLGSSMQLKKWCAERGIRATSFDSEHVAMLIKKLQPKVDSMGNADPKYIGYWEVLEMLKTKKIMGGSSLTKLQKILDTTGTDGRLRNQYMHAGAGQTYRSTGVGVQMQNLKRMGASAQLMEELYDQDVDFNNDELAENLRQVFTSSDKKGRLVVGDFASVESRGLAFLAGDDKKLQAYRDGKDLYKVQASMIYGVPYEQVDKQQRQVGKIGELSCGYGAGAGAVAAFAKNYDVEMSEAEALTLVRDWRDANPKIVALWDTIDEELHALLDGSTTRQQRDLANGLFLRMDKINTPRSLTDIHMGARSIKVSLHHKGGGKVLERVFHGCYKRGRSVCYYKPAERRTGPLWATEFRDPKTGQIKFHSIYGGKITGILTQSFCRELFFQSLNTLWKALAPYRNATIVGQFHDEIVVDWVPTFNPGSSWSNEITLDVLIKLMKSVMSTIAPMFKGFPLDAEIKSDYRYTK